jgi:hypothetical protein
MVSGGPTSRSFLSQADGAPWVPVKISGIFALESSLATWPDLSSEEKTYIPGDIKGRRTEGASAPP